MTHDIYFVKTRTNKQKQTDVLLYVNGGCGLNNCYPIKCILINNKKSICVSRAKICTLDKIEIGPDWITDQITDWSTESKK